MRLAEQLINKMVEGPNDDLRTMSNATLGNQHNRLTAKQPQDLDPNERKRLSAIEKEIERRIDAGKMRAG
jgi:hypothetical protein